MSDGNYMERYMDRVHLLESQNQALQEELGTARYVLNEAGMRNAKLAGQNTALQGRIEELEGILRAWRIPEDRPTQSPTQETEG
jgi:hypothetical protein